jgi:hypothetical protein
MMLGIVICVAFVALIWTVYAIICKVSQAFELTGQEQKNLAKEISEEKHDNPTPQQLVDFFNRPHA